MLGACLAAVSLCAAPVPVGDWTFDDPANLLQAATGQDLELVGSHTPVGGVDAQDGAVNIGVGSFYRCRHGLDPAGTGQAVNRYSWLFDVRIPVLGPWYCFFQTDPQNLDDGDCFVRSGNGTVGVGQTGYSARSITPGAWQRLVVSVDNTAGIYRLFLEGAQILEGNPQPIDGRFALLPEVLLFADENGEDAALDVTRVALFDAALSATDVAALGSLSGGSTNGILQLLTPPYLQHVKPDGITVMWELNQAVESAVEYGADTNYGTLVTGTSEATPVGTYVFRARLSGLNLGTTYHYRVRYGAEESADGRFTTAPSGSPDFAFGVWSDSQGSNHGTYPEDPLEPTKAMMRHLATNGVQFGVTAGDLAENGGSYSDTREYYLDRVATLLGTSVPWFVAWGNHDGDAGTVIRQFADLPSGARAGFGPGHGSYAFDYAGCHFVCLDYASATEDIQTWLEADLASEANRLAKFTFLFIHVPPFCELWIDGDAFLRAELVPLLERYGVDVCFSGHTHEYSRGYLNGVHYCITGGGSWLDSPEVLVHDWPHMTVGGQHEIPGVGRPGPERGGGLINEYVRVDVRSNSFTATMLGFSANGTFLGEFDRFGSSLNTTSAPPDRPVISGPAAVNLARGGSFTLASSAFSHPNPAAGHARSLWRLQAGADASAPGTIWWEGTTGAGVLEAAVPTAGLWPGQTIYATVRHEDDRGQVSPFAVPIPIALGPGLIHREDFEPVAEFDLPSGWTAAQWTSVDVDTADPENPRSNVYRGWTVVGRDRLGRVMGANRTNVAAVVQGRSVYAESDHRAGVQIQHLTTRDYDLAQATNVLLVFRSNYLQNQDSLGAVEYSVDGGATWGPVTYLLDRGDVVFATDGVTVDGAATFTRVDPDNVPTALGASASGGTYGEHIQARPFSALGPAVQARVNDDAVGSKRTEWFRLPAVDGASAVRFRFALVGTASWFWGIDDFSVYGDAVPVEPLNIVGFEGTPVGLALEWSGPPGPYQLQRRMDLMAGDWVDVGVVIEAGQRATVVPAAEATGFWRLRLAR